jgi:AI-2 transport protein TqsA
VHPARLQVRTQDKTAPTSRLKIKKTLRFCQDRLRTILVTRGGFEFVLGLFTQRRVRLAVLFALLSFILNFIPNVGSMIAIVLPIPV